MPRLTGTRRRRRPSRRHQGHLMVGVVSMIAIGMILSTVAVQEWSSVLQRDNEAEMMFRAQEISRAIFRYQQDRGTLPTKLEELLEPGGRGQYFIRRAYDDPLVPDGKWGLLYAAPGGGIVDPNAPEAGEPDDLGDRAMLESVGGLQGGFGDGAREVGGLGIIGVKTLCTDKPFRVYKGLSDYSQWLFTIYDLPGAQQQPGAGQGGQRPGGAGGVGGAGARGGGRRIGN